MNDDFQDTGEQATKQVWNKSIKPALQLPPDLLPWGNF